MDSVPAFAQCGDYMGDCVGISEVYPNNDTEYAYIKLNALGISHGPLPGDIIVQEVGHDMTPEQKAGLIDRLNEVFEEGIDKIIIDLKKEIRKNSRHSRKEK